MFQWSGASVPETIVSIASVLVVSVPVTSVPKASVLVACVSGASVPKGSVPVASVSGASVPKGNLETHKHMHIPTINHFEWRWLICKRAFHE